MSAESKASDPPLLPSADRLGVTSEGDRRFWIGLSLAVLVHILIIFGTLAQKGRRMGEPDASPDGVSVVIVDAADLQSRSSVPAQPPPLPPQAQAAPPQAQAAPPPQPPAPNEPEATKPTEPPPQEAPPAPQAEPPVREPPPRAEAPGDLKAQPQRPPRKPETHAAVRPSNPAPARPRPRVNFDPAPTVMSRGGSFAPTRPPGITRSGENDEFGRGVIRALIATIPQLTNTIGRVTVRIVLNSKGNLQSVEVVRPSGNGTIDQSVPFAVKQSNFPIPPDNATVLDRTFFVTYIFSIR